MSDTVKIYKYKSIKKIIERLRDDLKDKALSGGGYNYILLYAYNGTGKTRLSMEFKNYYKHKRNESKNTLYYNAFTEDLFYWDNDLTNDTERVLKINSDSNFFNGFKELALEEKIFSYLERYSEFDFKINYENWTISFSRGDTNNIKISRGEENIFIWCVFLSICELAIDGLEAYNWVKYIYIDDPISSLDDNNAIAVASDLSKLIKKQPDHIKTVISSHHSLFFNVICNELKKTSHKTYFLHRAKDGDTYTLRATNDTPFFHHVATLSEIKKATETGKLYTHHFNMMRSIMEKTATFFGFDDFSECFKGEQDEVLFSRALNLLSHGKYSTYTPREMNEDNKELFKRILNIFLEKYDFYLPEIVMETTRR